MAEYNDDNDLEDVLSSAMEDSAEIDVDDNSLLSVAQLAKKQLKLQREVDTKEIELKRVKLNLKKVAEIDLPNAMLENGMRNFVLDDGSSVEIERVYGGSISKGERGTPDNRPSVFKWMMEHGHAGLIKTNVTVVFGKGPQERKEAEEFAKELATDGFTSILDESIHAATLKAWVKAQDLALQQKKRRAADTGEKVDEDIYPPDMTVFVGERAKIKSAD